MIYWNVAQHMARKGWITAYRLASEAGISQPGAHRILSGHPVERVDTAVLLAVARALGVRNPLTLLEFRDE